MILIPAIDLLDGRCVRLRQGDFKQVQYYERAPRYIANHYANAGAEWLHVVDLAASRDGAGADNSALFDLLGATTQNTQTGGGVRNAADIEARLEAGANRVVVGSIAADEPATFLGWLEHFGPDRLVAALDVRIDEQGTPRVRSHGWTRESALTLWQLLDQFASGSLIHLLCTDIGRDGLMSGPNVALYQEIIRRYPTLAVQASGGVRDTSDLRTLSQSGAAAAISGKALLDGVLDLHHALEAVQ